MTGYLTANDRPGVHAPSWYAETAGQIPERPRLQGAGRADVCVVGGGYAGLSAALLLAGQGVDVALVEANRVGWGASGRNGGLLGAEPRADIRLYERLVGRDDARKVWDLAAEANALVRRLIAQHRIDCDLTDGYLGVAHRRRAAEEIWDLVEHVRAHYGHTSAEPLTAEALQARLGTAAYHGGFSDSLGAHLHPLRYALGLARAAEAAGARIYERSRASKVAAGLVTTDDGEIVCETVILAMNGYIDGLVPATARRSMPINNFLIATEPLGEDLARRIIPGREGVADSRFVVNYYHLTPDRRMIWGGGESYGRCFPRDIAALVRPRMLAAFPELAEAKITHAWGGTLAITATRMPVFQEAAPGVLAVHGWSGSGIHMATLGGAIAAEAVLGATTRWEVLSRVPTPPFPGGDWFRAPLLAVAMSLAALRDRW